MRIFSLIPAFLLVIVSFVAAAAITPTTAAVTSCAAESGNAAVLQCLTGAVKNANEQLQPLKDKLAPSENSGTPDADTVNQIGTALSTVTAQLQGVQPADFADLDVGDLITALLDLVANILGILDGVGGILGNVLSLVSGVLSLVSGLLGIVVAA